MSLTVEDNPASRARRTKPPTFRRTDGGADLWWQRPVRPVAAATADPAPSTGSEMLPTVMVGSAIVLFKLFMLGLLIYAV